MVGEAARRLDVGDSSVRPSYFAPDWHPLTTTPTTNRVDHAPLRQRVIAISSIVHYGSGPWRVCPSGKAARPAHRTSCARITRR